MPEIRVIEPIIFAPAEKLRVCAYARVSSDSTDQRNSFASQVNYYTKYIQAHEGWTFVDIYADQGITGTSALKRDEFLRLMRDCRQGKIDRILVKSVSRFARNAQDCIEAVRELRQLGVTVYFEKEHIIWKCPSCNTETRYLPDIELMSSVLSAINRAIEDPQKVMNFKKNANCLSVQAVRLENEIYRELGNPKSNSKRL